MLSEEEEGYFLFASQVGGHFLTCIMVAIYFLWKNDWTLAWDFVV
jgi:hypothetical protein